MFGKKNASSELTYIAQGTKLTGESIFSGDALIGGHVVGNVSSNSHVIVELEGIIDGEVSCKEIKISGKFKGKLFCEKLIITATGIFEGEVNSASIEIFDGGQFVGTRISAKPTHQSLEEPATHNITPNITPIEQAQ
ncbi:hypothetical protein SOPP22_08130 [Shewanella sp. OPT22]|uniref:bactofilin family protein n=1 Tax=Parashewanella hymeniacidonis TaxID=2807618 RepID=UPI001021F65B|nr:polymer-forming cytoskeletal protein [Parashewanella hymeniacidonis]MBM7071975.1 polymer-forming cytoskeletal protein [Parashewanella hymeniacidonis]RYV02488.1 hypothetical protein SOPP22_08130 [Shewanella sp. OPT22]